MIIITSLRGTKGNYNYDPHNISSSGYYQGHYIVFYHTILSTCGFLVLYCRACGTHGLEVLPKSVGGRAEACGASLVFVAHCSE